MFYLKADSYDYFIHRAPPQGQRDPIVANWLLDRWYMAHPPVERADSGPNKETT